MKGTFRNILIVRTDRIGDVVLTLPAVRALRRAFPGARLTMLATPRTRDLVAASPDLDDVLVDDRSGAHKGWGWWRLVGELRRKRFDLAVIFHTKKRTNLLCAAAGIPRRLGYRNEKLGFLLTDPVSDPRATGDRHEAEYCLDLLKAVGVSGSVKAVPVPVLLEHVRWADAIFDEKRLRGQPVFAVHAGASDPAKQWPKERFAELVPELVRRHSARVVLVGGPETNVISEWVAEHAEVPVTNLTGKTSVGQLAAVLQKCTMLVSNDSGPVHVADAVGTPVVSIFTRNQPGINPERWRPLGEKARVVAPPLQEGVSWVPVSEVLEAVDSVFKLC